MRPEPITVSTLNKYIKDKFVEDEYLNNVYIKGEISNFKHHYTGHMYFTLKDEESLIKCVMFKTATANLNFVPKDGMKVLILGTVSVFERDGVYQIYCKAMEEDGIGVLYKQFEELKLKLERKGYFADEHKKKIPFMPKRIGVLTSKTGSVIKDIINVSTRRNPNVNIIIFPIPVQGEGASIKIAQAIEYMNNNKIADVLILARGGGSLEDLWPFNEECVAEAIYNSDISEIKEKLVLYQKRYKLALLKTLEYMKLRYEKCLQSSAFTNPLQRINDKYIEVDNVTKEMQKIYLNKIQNYKISAIDLISRLDTLSPLKTLTRGYCVVNKQHTYIKSAKQLQAQDEITLTFTDGKLDAKIL